MNPFNDELWKAVSESLRKFSEGQKRINGLIEEAIKPLEESFHIKGEYFADLEDQLKRLGERLAEYFENTPEKTLVIAQHGWFIDLDCHLSLPTQVADHIFRNELEKADKLLIKYYEQNLDNIRKELANRHPKRKTIFNEVFECHIKGNYYVSVPTLLSQVDGICVDITGNKYFIGGGRKNVIAKFENLSGQIVEIFLTPIRNTIPITANAEEMQNYPYTLNRHEVMHGVVTDYGTKTNSIKCISMLKFFSDILQEIEK